VCKRSGRGGEKGAHFEMGTGKTCTAIGAIEQLRYDKRSNIKNAIILARGRNLLKNFTQELIFTCTDGRYIPENYENLSELEKVHRINKITSEFYSFFTFETFAKNITNLGDRDITARFSNSIIILDEVHNIREKDEIDREQVLFKEDPLYVYKQIHRFLHLVKESKIILLSGTVMKDDPSEFGSIMNLILPLSNQFPTDKSFNLEYFENNKFKPDKVQEFSDRIRGRTSYLRAMSSDVKKIFNGQRLGSLQHFLIYPDTMSDFQSLHYSKARDRDLSERSIFISSRQASLFVFPDGSYGSEGFDRYVSTRGRGGGMVFSLNSELTRLIRATTYDNQLKNLSKYSSKYAATIGTILSTSKTKALVYSEFVSGGGAILFSKILELFGFSKANGNETTKSPRYAILTAQTANLNRVQTIINRFNNEDNLDGEFISVIIGSRVISEGFTLKNIRQEFILTPHWNFSETSQVIARGWRIGSHHSLIHRGDKDLKVDVYLQASIPKNHIPSIDLIMYEKSEQKDYLMKQIEYLVKTTSFDCPLTYDRNRVSSYIYNNTRDCEYTNCDYKCDGTILETSDKITYNLYYISKQLVKKRLLDYFRTENFIEFPRLFLLLNELNTFEILFAVKSFIDTDVEMYNKYDQVSYLRVCNDFLFITTDVKTQNNDVFSAYYTANNIIGNYESFDDISETIYEDRIPDMIQTLFDPSTQEIMIPEIMSALPERVQVTILQSCIKARFQNLKKNQQPRNNILGQYKGFYRSISFESIEWWVVWMHNDLYGISCFNGGEWKNYLTQSQDFIDFVNDQLSQTKDRLFNSPVGFYGLHNPQLNDFCLRDVRNITTGKDLRKLAVGKRCVDFKYGTLLNLLVKEIKAPYKPVDYLAPLNDGDLIKSLKEKNVDFERDPDDTDFENRETMKRYLYWADRKRPELCKHIQIWMEENDLIESSFDCGTQQKRRV
jgi:hypothetical protein